MTHTTFLALATIAWLMLCFAGMALLVVTARKRDASQ